MTSAGKSVTGENRFFCCWQLPGQEMVVCLFWGLVGGWMGKMVAWPFLSVIMEAKCSQQGAGGVRL